MHGVRLFYLLLLSCTFIQPVFTQEVALKGIIRDKITKLPLEAVSLHIEGAHVATSISNSSGQYRFNLEPGQYTIKTNSVGFESFEKTFNLSGDQILSVELNPTAINLQEITVLSNQSAKPTQLFSALDKVLRPVNSAQDLLQLVPGLFIAQHAGGGKAEQIFLRGFDSDHGTDFYISVDGMPVNMVSHAHGQGYADFHFVIPESIDRLAVHKGPYNARFGDFSTSGTGEFSTKNGLDHSLIKLEAGQFNTFRGLGMFNLLCDEVKGDHQAYLAGEFVHTDSYFDKKQNFNRYNLFGKYFGKITPSTTLQFSASTFDASWSGSGQIPERAIATGQISRYGQIDTFEGGNTGRTNLNGIFYTQVGQNDLIKNQFFFTRYDFSLFSNFTFFLNDPIRGDEIHQIDHRSIYGYHGSFQKNHNLLHRALTSTFGLSTRMDFAGIALLRSQRRIDLEPIVAGQVNQINTGAYYDADWAWSDRWLLNAGVRLDHFIFKFKSESEPAKHKNKAVVSPKLNLYYQASPTVKLFAKSGIGFHSNDARSVVLGQSENSLPKATGYELGGEFKVGKSLLMNMAAWSLHSQSELVYVGDEGVVETNSPTQRIGLDLAARYQMTRYIIADLDININRGRLIDAPAGENNIPLAPRLTSTGGVQYMHPNGLNAAIRYKMIGSRPANEDNSIRAQGYMIWDATIKYSTTKFEYGISMENLLNTEWNQAQFDTTSRLYNEAQEVSELHFTPGTPRFVKASVSYKF